MIQVGDSVYTKSLGKVLQIYKGVAGKLWAVVEFPDGHYIYALVSDLEKPKETTDDGPEVEILREPVIPSDLKELL